MKILYLTTKETEHLADDLLYGLRKVLGGDVVDWPKKRSLYAASRDVLNVSRDHGLGFNCFGLTEDPCDRRDIYAKLVTGYFDWVVNSSCWRIQSPLHPRLIAVDGEDHPMLNQVYLRVAAHYFKGELPLPQPGISPLLFSLPDHLAPTARHKKDTEILSSFMIAQHQPWETSCAHIRVELARAFPPKHFDSVGSYLNAIDRAWFMLSPKGFGWDCPRHYEALGRAIPCIQTGPGAAYDLDFYFKDGRNCVTFETVAELKKKLKEPMDREAMLERGRWDLFNYHLSSKRAEQFLTVLEGLGERSAFASDAQRATWAAFFGAAHHAQPVGA